jgi:hypothetical protein
MPETVLVLGAGVDKTQGIDFPLAADLLPAINGYLTRNEEGKQVEQLLRSKIPDLRFRFDRFINSAITDIAHREPEELRATIQRVQQAVAELPEGEEHETTRKQGQLIVRLFDQLQSIAEHNAIDEETRNLIEEVFGEDVGRFDLDDHIVDIRTLSVSDTVKNIIRYTLRQSLESGANEVAHALGADLLNIEQLLIEKFLGFYNNKLPDIKSYVYISWCFWAYLVHENKRVRNEGSPIPFYKDIPDGWHGVTLNYTSFLEDQLGTEAALYFHGGLSQYVRMDNRMLLRFDDFENHSALELLESHICDSWRFDRDEPWKSVCLIPSLIPPLRLKPILSKEYIELWHRAAVLLESAENIVIIGYSLNTADEHFNDLLRGARDKGIFIVGPGATQESFVHRVTKIFGVAASEFTNSRIQNLPAKQAHRIHLIKGFADQVDLAALIP